MRVKNSKKLNKFLALSLTIIALTSGSFVVPEVSIASEERIVAQRERLGARAYKATLSILDWTGRVQTVVYISKTCSDGLANVNRRGAPLNKASQDIVSRTISGLCQGVGSYTQKICQASGLCKEHKIAQAQCESCGKVIVDVQAIY